MNRSLHLDPADEEQGHDHGVFQRSQCRAEACVQSDIERADATVLQPLLGINRQMWLVSLSTGRAR